MTKVNAIELMGSETKGLSGNDEVKVNVDPVVGTGPTQLGMFDISVSPVNSDNQLINVQFIVQYEGQAQQEFTAFIIFPALPKGFGYGATPMYCSAEAVTQNRLGKSLTVMVVGGVNAASDPFFVTHTFTQNLWPA